MAQPQNPPVHAGNNDFTVQFKTVIELQKAYLSFVQEGAIFIETKKPFHLGERISLQIQLPKNEKTFSVSGEIIWVASDVEHGTKPGIAVQCSDGDAEAFRTTVETLLSNEKDISETHTM